jgi:hypothetical protein
MKKLLASITFALSLSPAFAGGPEWQPFFTCDTTGTGGTCSYTVTASITMPSGSYTTNTISVYDSPGQPGAGTSHFRWTQTTSLTLKDGSGNSMCGSPFTGTSYTGTVFGTSITVYRYVITCGSTGLTGGNTYTLTATGTSSDSIGSVATVGPSVNIQWSLN